MKNRENAIGLFVACVASTFLFACAKRGEQFIGTWSNEWTDGRIHIVVRPDAGERYLVKQVLVSNGAVISTGLAKVDGDYLIVNEGTGMFEKFAYSGSENALLLVNRSDSPVYRKIGE